MIKPVLDDIYFPFGENPKDITDFIIPVEAFINEVGNEGADGFSFRITTPKRLVQLAIEEPAILGRAIFIVNGTTMQENIEYVTKEVNRLLLQCARETWEETALAINYYLDWEYYDPSIGICDYYLQSRNLKKQQFYIE